MTREDISTEQISAITAFVDIEAPPPDKPTAHIIFGTKQAKPAEITAERYRRGLAPLIIATGGTNRHNGINEVREFRRILTEQGVPDTVIRTEDRSTNTWQNVEFSLPFLREALDSGLTITAVCKWYHRRAVHILKTLAPDIGAFHVITWDPIYASKHVSGTDWPLIPDGKRQIIREWEEVSRRVSDGSFKEANLVDGACVYAVAWGNNARARRVCALYAQARGSCTCTSRLGAPAWRCAPSSPAQSRVGPHPSRPAADRGNGG